MNDVAEKIVTAFEGRFREWMMPGEHAEAVALVAEVLEATSRGCSDEKARVRELWETHLGPHKCDVHGVDKFLAALESWMLEEKQ